MSGSVYLVPVTLGDTDFSKVITGYVTEIAKSLRYYVVEDIRSARRFLRLIDKSFPIDETVFFELNEHTGKSEISSFLEPARHGHNIGLMSEAGLPGIADPGMHVVRLAHREKIKVVPLSGPSSIILALVSSGLDGQNFIFHGYLSRKAPERISKLKEIEKRIDESGTQIFMETPYRAQKMFEALISSCMPETLLCIASDITLSSEDIRTMRIADWKKQAPALDNRLVIFLIGK